jgi:hypothetical protein
MFPWESAPCWTAERNGSDVFAPLPDSGQSRRSLQFFR